MHIDQQMSRIPVKHLLVAIAGALLSVAAPGVKGELLIVNPDMAPRLCPSKYLSRDGAYEFNVRVLPRVEKIFVEDRTITAGTTEYVVFLVPREAGVYIASTKIVGNLASNASSLAGQAAQRRVQVVADPKAISTERIATKFGDTYALSMLNVSTAGRDSPFPFSYVWRAGSTELPSSASAHRFFVTEGHLIEVAVLLLAEWQPTQEPGALKEKANGIVDSVLKQISSPATVCTK